MKVSIDGARKNIVNPLAQLIQKLNNAIEGDCVVIPVDEIQNNLDDLRQSAGMLCCIYSDKEEMFTDISDYADRMPWFNCEASET